MTMSDMTRFFLAAAALALVLASCYPARTVTLHEGPQIQEDTHDVDTPVKGFLFDGSVVVFPQGFTVVDSSVVTGEGRLYPLGSQTPLEVAEVPLDSIAAMTYYEVEHMGASSLGSFILGTYGPMITAASLYCISCPKCCFGSCPTIYTGEDAAEQLEAELFSYSLSRFYQEHDLDRLREPVPPDGRYRIRLTNEALETHYIDELTLLEATHPPGTETFPTSDGRIVATRALRPPSAAVSAQGRDVRDLLRRPDETSYRSHSDSTGPSAPEELRDWIDLEVDVPEEADSLVLVFRLRNTLLSTVLFYNVVLASQGIDALRWTERLNTDSSYAADYHALYNAFAGLTISTRRAGSWVDQAVVPDVGPIAWKDLAAVIPVEGHTGMRMPVRLSFFPDNLLIDYVAADSDDGSAAVTVEEIRPTAVHDHTGRVRDDAKALLSADDEQFLVTEAGDNFELVYATESKKTAATTLFIRSNGYYLEWLRGDWIVLREGGYRFDLYQIDETLTALRQSWHAHRDELEARFFETRIPTRGR